MGEESSGYSTPTKALGIQFEILRIEWFSFVSIASLYLLLGKVCASVMPESLLLAVCQVRQVRQVRHDHVDSMFNSPANTTSHVEGN